ncbi:MAG: hypothetical protein K2W96_17270, partial [Gemmataceae bacterium]|nr:hypothetical protein [Gemmataceae bacterium]
GTPAPDKKAEDDDEARKKLDEREKHLAEKAKALEDEKAKLAAGKLLDRAEAAMKAGKHAEAEKLFDEARKLDPADTKAVAGLVKARTALELVAKSAEADDKREAEKAKLLAEGLSASKEKKYAQAVTSLEAARAIAPADKAVLDALAEARAGLDADEAQKKALAEYGKVLASAKLALDGNRFSDAARDFAAALVLVPDSAEAKDGLKAAEGKLAGLADAEKRRKEADRLIDQARAAQGRMAFKEAVAALQLALKLLPEDKEAARLLKVSEGALERARKESAALVTKGKAALANLRYDEAVRFAGDAAKAWPEDNAARLLLKEAERQQEAARTAAMAYVRSYNEGTFAMAAGRYGDAVVAFTEALRLNPLNVDIARDLRNARIALERDVRNKAEYERLVRAGTLALSRKMWAEAKKAFGDAIKLLPGDLAAKEGLSRARYGKAMQEGNRALMLKRKAEALSAFEAALAELPGDAAALEGQRRAKAVR